MQFYGSGSRHLFDAEEGFEGAEQDRSSLAFRLTGNVQAVVIAVDEIYIGVAGWAEENGGAGGDAGEGVGGGVGLPEVGFDLDDASSERNFLVSHQHFAKKVAGNALGVAGEEGAG